MKFINSTGKDDSLYHYTLYLLGKSATDTTSYASTDWVRSAKTYHRKAGYIAWRNSGAWDFDDSNYTTLPIATADLVAAQQDYALPSNAFDVQRAEVMASDGRYRLLNRMDKAEVKDEALSEYYSTDGLPKYYDLVGNSLMLYPAPAAANVTTTAGLKLYLSRDVTEPTMTTGSGAFRDITTTPGFQVSQHPYIAIGCAVDYGVSKNYTAEKMANLRLALKEYEQGITDYFAERDRDYPTKFRPSVRSSI